jgi:3-keto-disaccharide hydrolase
MWRYLTMLVLVVGNASIAGAPPSRSHRTALDAVVGRWDITIQTPDRTLPSWLEIRPSGRATLVGRFVGDVGSARPISRIELSGGTMRFSIPPQWEQGEGDLSVEGKLEGEQLSGSMTYPDGKRFNWTAKRAPLLRRQSAPEWAKPMRLFNGTDVSGWHVLGASQWRASNGVLRNTEKGGNLVTDRTFTDFKLHIEFRYPKGSNSGVYLRGRHEVQIEDSLAIEPANDLLGAVYGFLPPSEVAARKPGEWQYFDITLVGRMVTVVANGKTVICNREIPGITGGALDSDEGAPGPLLLQGDHGPVEFRNITLRPAKGP